MRYMVRRPRRKQTVKCPYCRSRLNITKRLAGVSNLHAWAYDPDSGFDNGEVTVYDLQFSCSKKTLAMFAVLEEV